eukprot:Filipodium_phascolosomae@DN6734_c0_g1_i1.p1
MGSAGKSKEPLRILSIDISSFSAAVQLLIVGSFHVVFSIGFAYCQERASKVDKFEEQEGSSLMVLGTTMMFVIFGCLELLLMHCTSKEESKDFFMKPKAPWTNYVILSLPLFFGMYCTNKSLKYISYATRIVFKGSKPIPSLIVEHMYVGIQFSIWEVADVITITLGIVAFVIGDNKLGDKFHIAGTLLMLIGVVSDVFTSSYEKKKIFGEGANHAEALLYSSLLASLWTVTPILFSTEFATKFCSGIQNREMMFWICVSGVFAYFSLVFVLKIIHHFTATAAECVKGIRKVGSVSLSFILMGRSFSKFHLLGIGLLLLSVVTGALRKAFFQQRRKIEAPASSKSV